MKGKKEKKKLEGLDELEDSFNDDIYKDFQQENNVEEEDKTDDSKHDTKDSNTGYKYQEKEYNSGFLESHTVATTTRVLSKTFLIIFYAIVLVVGVGVFFMLREDRYRFYLKNDEVTIGNGSKYQVELTPKNSRYFDYLNYNYEIKDGSIATVDEYGTVTAAGIGTTELKISIKSGFTSRTMKINVEEINVESIQLKVDNNGKLVLKNSISMGVDESITLHAQGNDRDDLNLTVNYVSNNPDVATVDEFGNVTAVSPGIAIITGSRSGVEGSVEIRVKDNGSGSQVPTPTPVPGSTITPKPSVTATPKPVTPTAHVQTVDIGISMTSKYIGETLQLKAKVTPSNAEGYPVTWSSSNESVATVSKNGLVTAKKVGTAVIKAVVDGKEASGTIIVRNKTGTTTPTTNPNVTPTPASSTPKGSSTFNTKYVKGSTLSLTVNKGKTATFNITLNNAAGQIKVASENPSIATVSESDFWLESTSASTTDSKTITVTGKSAGTVKINVDLADVSTFDTVEPLTGRHTIVVVVK